MKEKHTHYKKKLILEQHLTPRKHFACYFANAFTYHPIFLSICKFTLNITALLKEIKMNKRK